MRAFVTTSRRLFSSVSITPARQCIRDVVAVLRDVETFIGEKNPGADISLEEMVRRADIGSSSSFTGVSCGNTVQCYASSFLSPEQINRQFLFELVAGGILSQITNNRNLFVSMGAYAVDDLLAKLFHKGDSSDFIHIKNVLRMRKSGIHHMNQALLFGSSYCRSLTTGKVDSLQTELLGNDQPNQLPRVFFCSMSWSLELLIKPMEVPKPMTWIKDNSGVNLDNLVHSSSAIIHTHNKEKPSWDTGFQDHEMIIIKRDRGVPFSVDIKDNDNKKNDNSHQMYEYQVIQGYRALNEEIGYSSAEWQASKNRFSSVNGFSSETMISFLDHLRNFGMNEFWDPDNHFETFGVLSSKFAGKSYLPAFSYRELADDSIIGFGDRPLSDKLSQMIQQYHNSSSQGSNMK